MRSEGRACRRLAAVLSGLTILVAGCAAAPAARAETLAVATAFYPLEEVARRVGGPLVEVINLTPPGAEPHDLELRPSDVQRVRSADLVLYLGGGFQPALERAIGGLSGRSRALDLLAGLPVKAPGQDERELTADPHVWLSPALMQRIVDAVYRAFADRLPSRSTGLAQRSESLKDDLAALDEEFGSGLRRCTRRELFTSHAAFAYLADRYNLTQVGVTGLEPEAEPSSRRLQEVAELARRSGATTIFFETLVSPRVADAVARIVGAKTAVLDPIEGLSPVDQAAGADYFSVMRANLTVLREALGCRR